jgi:CheY-like chemotaxis protein
MGGERVGRILIIDDEPSVRRLLGEVLKGAGHDLVEVSTAKEGLRLLGERAIDLVITDILMPDMDGLEVIRNVRREFPKIKIIAISGGRQDIDYCDVARCFGADETLMKPVTIQALRDTVTRLLQSPA